MEDASALGRMIRESRLKQGMSLSQLASEVGRSSSSVRRWERGEVPPAKSVMPQLAEILDVDQAELDALRPGAVSAATAAEESAGDDGPSTIEQPAVPTDAEPEEPSAEVVVAPRRRGLFGDVATAWQVMTEGWTGWIRGFATAAVLVVLLVVLVWAASELFQALGEVWDSFDAGS